MKKEVTLTVGSGKEVRGLATSAQENYIVAGSTDGLITVFELG